MDLIDRYLIAVRRQLPRNLEADIAPELVVVPIALFGGAIHAIHSGDPAAIVGRVIGSAWSGAIYAVGIVTIVFAVLDHEKVRINVLDNWDPAKLREPESRPRCASIGVGDEPRRLPGVPCVVDDAGPRARARVYADAELRVTAAPIWSQLYFPILVAVIASLGLHLVDVVRPWRTFATSAADLAINFLNLFIVTGVLRAGRYVEVTGAPADADKVALANHWFNLVIGWAFMAIGVVIILEVCFELWRMVKARRTLQATISSTAL